MLFYYTFILKKGDYTMEPNNMINEFFGRLGTALSTAASTVVDLFFDYFLLIIAIGCWLRFINSLFIQGKFSYLLLLWAVLTTVGAIALGQIFWTNPLFNF